MEQKVNQNIIGLSLDAVSWQLKDNQITWALNANIQSHDGESITYTNEPSTTACFDFEKYGLDGFQIVGYTNITEQSKVVLFLAHPDGRSRIGEITSINDSCQEVITSEEDCGCAQGTILKGTVIETLPANQMVTKCPDGYLFNSITNKCETTESTEATLEKETYFILKTSDSAWGFVTPSLYDEGWNIGGWGGNGTYLSGVQRLNQIWWRSQSFGSPSLPTWRAGRVNEIAIRVQGDATNKWLGFTTTLCVEEEKTYYLALAADDRFRVSLDNTMILDPYGTEQSWDTWKTNNYGSPGAVNAERISYMHLHIYPIKLTKGNHFLTYEYINSGGPQMFAAEIYENTSLEIINAQSINDLKIVWSTKDQTAIESIKKIGCPEGYEIGVDEDCAFGCIKTVESDLIVEELPGSCCVYKDIVVDNCLPYCPDTCYSYKVFIKDIGAGYPEVTGARTVTYVDCLGVTKTVSVTENVTFTARKGTLEFSTTDLYIEYETKVPDPGVPVFSNSECCLNLKPEFPVNAEYRIDNCETKIYYASRNNPPRMFAVEHPYGQDACGEDKVCIKDSCEDSKLFPNFCQPEVHVTAVNSGGNLRAGVYSFSIAYADQEGNELTDYVDLTNPIPIFERAITEQVEYNTSKSINVRVFHNTRIFEYFNLVVAETVRTVTSYYLVNTFRVNQLSDEDEVLYTGDYKLPFNSITPIVRSPHYATANIIEKQNDILMLADLEETPKYNFQPFSSRLELFWETVEMPADGDFDYSNPEVAYFFRTFQRDEVYAFGIKFKLFNGKYTDTFHIPGRKAIDFDLEVESASTNDDVFIPSTDCIEVSELPRWRVYNTATVTEPNLSLDVNIGTKIEKQYNCKITSHKRGLFSYWESTEEYPCYDEVWEQSVDPNRPYYNPDALGGRPIRHHKFPDSAVVHIHDAGLAPNSPADITIKNNYVSKMYPIGVRINKVAMEALLNEEDVNQNYVYTVYDPILRKDIPIKDLVCGFELVVASRVGNKSVVAKGLMYDVGTFVDQTNGKKFYYSNYPYNDLRLDPYLRTDYDWYKSALYNKSNSEKNKYTWDAFSHVRANGNNRYTFYSPDTSFQFPKIGTELKLETVEFGHVLGHFVQVDEHPRHRLMTDRVYYHAGIISALFGINISGETSLTATGGTNALTTVKYDQMIVTEQIILDIVEKLIPLTNYAWQYNSIANYNQYIPVGGYARKGNTRRLIDLGYYANEKIVEVYDDAPLHNRLRETSVYLKTNKLFPNLEPQIVDNSRYLASSHGVDPIVLQENRLTKAIYASIKRDFPNQYGNLENLRYHTMGYSLLLSKDLDGTAHIQDKYYPAFGGDTFINKFALKRKHSFFTKNLVNLPARVDEYSYDYWLFPNLGYPTYYIGASSDDITTDDLGVALIAFAATYIGLSLAAQGGAQANVAQLIAAQGMMATINVFWSKFNKKVALDDEGDKYYYRNGKFYTASYGIPIFFVESDVNVDLRYGRDSLKDNFYPNAGGGVPDEWLQEVNVPIKYDNFYYYDASFSIVNLSPNIGYRLKYPSLECLAYHQNRVIYSDQASKANFLTDPWRNYRPLNFYDFPKQGGRLVDLNAGDQERVYARFENTTKVYNARIVLDSTAPYQLEIGNADMFKQKPVDLKSTDTGYIGTQHKAYVRCEYGTFWVDAKRGHIYQLTGDGFNEIKNELNYNWFKENLPFQILKDLPNADVDASSIGIGIVMGWDERFERVFITKLDYRVKPQYRTGNVKVVYDSDRSSDTFKKYLLDSDGVLTPIRLGDTKYFENKSWTVAYSPKMKNFISFYSFLPNFFIPQLGHFQTAINTPTGASLWNHNLSVFTYQTYYGKLYPYILEYSVNSLPINGQVNSVSLVADIQEYYSSYEYYSLGTTNNTNLANFTKAIIYNKEQSSGIINLIPEKFGDKKQKIAYPRVTVGGIETLLSRRENKYTFNGFWNLAAQSNGQPLWTTQWSDLQASYPIDKLPNPKAIRPVGVSFQKNKIKSEFTRVRLIQDKYNRYKFVNHIQINQLNNTNL
jgi:hypothetical protein